MANWRRLLPVVFAGALIVTSLWFLLALAIAAALETPRVPEVVKGIAVATTVLLPIGCACWWVFRKLRLSYTRRQAFVAAMAFGVVSPMQLGIGILVGPIVGGYSDNLLGTNSGPVALAGAMAGIVVTIAITAFVVDIVVLSTVGPDNAQAEKDPSGNG